MTHAPIARLSAVDWKSHVSTFLPLAVAVITAAIAWGALSNEVGEAKETLKAQAAEVHDLQKRQNAQETLEAVTISRLDDLKASVDKVDGKIDRLGEAGRGGR